MALVKGSASASHAPPSPTLFAFSQAAQEWREYGEMEQAATYYEKAAVEATAAGCSPNDPAVLELWHDAALCLEPIKAGSGVMIKACTNAMRCTGLTKLEKAELYRRRGMGHEGGHMVVEAASDYQVVLLPHMDIVRTLCYN